MNNFMQKEVNYRNHLHHPGHAELTHLKLSTFVIDGRTFKEMAIIDNHGQDKRNYSTLSALAKRSSQ